MNSIFPGGICGNPSLALGEMYYKMWLEEFLEMLDISCFRLYVFGYLIVVCLLLGSRHSCQVSELDVISSASSCSSVPSNIVRGCGRIFMEHLHLPGNVIKQSASR